MPNHFTPVELAGVLAKHAPKEIRHLLDPAVGTGALLTPFSNGERVVHRITGIDKRRSVVPALNKAVQESLRSKFTFILGDFLQWATEAEQRQEKFDCIIMNPPFAARSRQHVSALQSSADAFLRNLPIELAFLVKSLRLLEPAGRLLAILPSSVISAGSTRVVRELLLNQGAVLSVHEVPQNSFKRIDGHIYLLAFEKTSRQRTLMLCNSDLFHPKRIHISQMDLGVSLRLDYSYHSANKISQAMVQKHDLCWRSLAKIATILRGSIESPIKKAYVLHTIHRDGPFWSVRDERARSFGKEVTATRYDILMSRVGRKCVETAGILVDHKPREISDCVHIIRPHRPRDRNRILFALRVATKMSYAKGLLERGTGAAYITQSSLREFQIPVNLWEYFQQHYSRYIRSIRMRSRESMIDIEAEVADRLVR